MVNASRASRDVASELLLNSVIFDTSVRRQTDGALCKAVPENKIASSILSYPRVVRDAVLLTCQDRNRLALWCDL